jgi:hypothetical protein
MYVRSSDLRWPKIFANRKPTTLAIKRSFKKTFLLPCNISYTETLLSSIVRHLRPINYSHFHVEGRKYLLDEHRSHAESNNYLENGICSILHTSCDACRGILYVREIWFMFLRNSAKKSTVRKASQIFLFHKIAGPKRLLHHMCTQSFNLSKPYMNSCDEINYW